MDNDSQVSSVYDPNELEVAQFRMMDVRFDCLVRMFDSGMIQPRNIIPFVKRKSLPPQWFKSEMKFTMEFVEDSSPYSIGCVIKDMFKKLKLHIENYEKTNV